MRMPWSKIYRAFPELDAFTDDQCSRFVYWAKSRNGVRLTLIPAVAAVAWAAMVFFVASLVFEVLPRGTRHDGLFNTALLLTILALAWSIGVALIARDLLLIRVIRERVRGGRCPECRFSLLGLPILGGTLVCPECGTNMTLHELGLTHHDLLDEND